MSWDAVFTSLTNKSDLSNEQITWAMAQILEGKAGNDQIKQFLLGLKLKGESASEVSALVAQMYQYAAPINITERAVDTVGTGGDGANTINISTAAAIITNAAGARVVKHGNRAATSKSGSADLLEALITGPQSMPVFSDKIITPQEKLSMIKWIKSAESEPSLGGAALGRVGPVTEGLVAWVLGLGLLVGCCVWLTAKAR